jgi:hypothetical protein
MMYPAPAPSPSFASNCTAVSIGNGRGVLLPVLDVDGRLEGSLLGPVPMPQRAAVD